MWVSIIVGAIGAAIFAYNLYGMFGPSSASDRGVDMAGYAMGAVIGAVILLGDAVITTAIHFLLKI